MSTDDRKAEAAQAASVSNVALFGEIVWLYSFSSIHQKWPISKVHQWIVPALKHRQLRVYRRGDRPIAYVSWAKMSKEVEEAYVLNPSGLRPEDWVSGPRIWFVDWIAPFGGTREIARDIKHNVFPNDVGRSLRMREGNSTLQINYFHGVNAIERSRDREADPAVTIPSPKPPSPRST